MYWFTNDDRAILEPQNDIFATALLVLGFVVFACVASKAYIAHQDSAFALESYEQASLIAQSIAHSQMLQGSRQDLISAEKLDALSGQQADIHALSLFFDVFSPNVRFQVDVSTEDGEHIWHIHKPASSTPPMGQIAASVPVTLELNPVQQVPGTLTVKLFKDMWNS
ncbi:MAG: hypothetical protein WBL02_05095 [Methanomethylovorans sp.]|uniref:hypothetical protein n=1 Tax=Methanomethylovorans sp. TaxID=2758717 RepID=UPI000AF40BBA|nr:hypothetical protein [Methanomethylovorans sp.]